MIKEELIQLSDNIFTSNNTKQIRAINHRYFNEKLIESVVTGASQGNEELPLKEGIIQIPDVPVYDFTLCEFENSDNSKDYANI